MWTSKYSMIDCFYTRREGWLCKCALSESGELKMMRWFVPGGTNQDWCDGHTLSSPPHHCHCHPIHPHIFWYPSLQHNSKTIGIRFLLE
jgi:hypothetical protein